MNEALREELISAALDGERVDVAALRAALDTPDGQRSLAAFVLLRAATADELGDAGQPALSIPTARPGYTTRRWRRLPVAVAASVGAVALAGSFWLGTTWTPDEPARAPMATAAAPPDAEEPPPVPTRRLEYVPGVDWQTGS